MTEVELAKRFIEYFGDMDVYQEVPMGGRTCDIVVRNGVLVTGIEVKKTFNFDVIDQARSHEPYLHYTYVAFSGSGVPSIKMEIAKMLGIGILAYNPLTGQVSEFLKPRLRRKVYRIKLEEWMKDSVAGSQWDRVTAFGYFNQELVRCVKSNEGITFKALYDMAPRHYRSLSIFRSALYTWVRKGVIKGIKIEDGKIYAA